MANASPTIRRAVVPIGRLRIGDASTALARYDAATRTLGLNSGTSASEAGNAVFLRVPPASIDCGALIVGVSQACWHTIRITGALPMSAYFPSPDVAQSFAFV